MSVFEPLKEHLRSNGFDPTGLETMLEDYLPPPDAPLEHAFQFIVENQRGMKLFGIPCFNHKSLIPILDPSQYTRIDGSIVKLADDHIGNYPLPDLSWRWAWDSWYVSMLNDVDEQGWYYSSVVFRKGSHWHGKYNFGNFVRRRLWMRLRVRDIPQSSDSEEDEEAESSKGAENDIKNTASPAIRPSSGSEVRSMPSQEEIDRQASLSAVSPRKTRKPAHSMTTWA